jgi:hypothetical protein
VRRLRRRFRRWSEFRRRRAACGRHRRLSPSCSPECPQSPAKINIFELFWGLFYIFFFLFSWLIFLPRFFLTKFEPKSYRSS